ncbi:hypothetical protein CDL12_25441 [Handroanthus impetiginosus]|uniref:Myb/SANT-like domain-containing protein n=1 Tax=Handroanthus impetiginosus TaxID=429701 RepID=A0A2G9G9T7_9LAMI|nr:hypothetical protein CDL12_25441 [Handroanthus impetiginosus]
MAQSVTSSKSTDRSTKAPAEPRRFWTPHEDETLIQSLKELQKLPSFGLCIKHTESKLQVWKKTYATLLGILSTSRDLGATMDPSTYTIVVENESVWDEYVKVHQEARSLKNRSQPMYDSWVEIFGTDRATGVGSIDAGDIVTEMLNKACAPNVEVGADDTIQPLSLPCSARKGTLEGAEYDALSMEATPGSASKNKTNPLSKRKHSEDAAELNQPKQTQAEMDSSRRAALFQVLRELPVLSLDDRINATRHLAHNKGDMDAFWRMDKKTLGRFVMILLGANFGSFD